MCTFTNVCRIWARARMGGAVQKPVGAALVRWVFLLDPGPAAVLMLRGKGGRLIRAADTL